MPWHRRGEQEDKKEEDDDATTRHDATLPVTGRHSLLAEATLSQGSSHRVIPIMPMTF